MPDNSMKNTKIQCSKFATDTDGVPVPVLEVQSLYLIS